MKKRLEYAILFCLLIIIIILTFYEVFSGYKIFVSGDSLSPISLREGINKLVDNNHSYPLWIPWIFSGMPSIHSFINISELYYPQFLFVLLNKIGIPWIWNFLFHLIFSGLGMYSLLRYLSCSRYASLFSSVLFMISPYMVAMTVFGHGSQVMTASYIPFIILFLFKLYKEKKSYHFPIFALLVGFQLQRGHIQIAYYTWMMIGLFIVLNNYKIIKIKTFQMSALIKHNVYVLTSLVSGLLLSFNIYLPVLNYLGDSTRGSTSVSSGIDFATQWSFSFKESLSLFFPYFLGFGGKLYSGNMPFTDYPNYLGIVIFILAIIGFLKSNINKDYKIFFLLVACFSFFISLGHNFILFYKIFYYCFPYFDKFRVPVYLLILFYFSILIFSAFGLDHLANLINKKLKLNKYLKYISLKFFPVIFLFIFYPRLIYDNNTYNISLYDLINHDIIIIISLLILFIISLIIIANKKYPLKYFYVIVFTICCYDYLRIDHEIISASKHLPHSKVLKDQKYVDDYLSKDEIINSLLADSTKFRIFDFLGPQNKWAAFHIENINGYHPAKLDNYNKLISKIKTKGYSLWPPSILKLLNVKYLIMPYDNFNHPDFEKTISSNMYYFGGDERYDGKKIQSYVYKYKNYYPRLFYTENIHNVLDEDVYDIISDENFDPIKNSYIFENEKISFNFDKDSKVKLLSWTPDKLIFETNVNSKQFLVISEVFYPNGWKISDGSNNYKIYNVNGILRGVIIPPGIHKFTMSFSPFDVKLGQYISMFTFISLIVIFLYFLSRNSKVKNVEK